MFVVLIFFGVMYLPELGTPPPPLTLEIFIKVCDEKSKHPPTP